MVAIGVLASTMKVDNSMETIRENVVEQLFMAWTNLVFIRK
jgi:hypothetical protein